MSRRTSLRISEWDRLRTGEKRLCGATLILWNPGKGRRKVLRRLKESLSVGRATVFRWRRQGLLRLAGGKENSVFVRFSALIFSRCFFFRLALFFRFFRLGKPGIVP